MKFSYIALDKLGKRTIGDVEAESSKAAADMLRAQSLLPIKVDSGGLAAKHYRVDVKNIFGKVSLVEKVTFIKNLAVMLKSGFPVSRALHVLSEQSANSTFTKALADVASQVEAGQTLADAMARYPKIFSNLFTNVVKVGEISGNLEQTLFGLATQLKKDHDLIRKTKGAMIYPAIVLFAMFLVSVVMFTFVLPKLTSLFDEFEVELPVLTRAILALVGFMKSYGLFILLAAIAGVAGLVASLRYPSVRFVLDGLALRAPIVGQVAKYTNLARLCRTLASLLRSGMPILESIRVTGEALGNSRYRAAINEAEKLIRSGTQLSATLRNYPKLFTSLLVSMVTVGEESGTVDAVLEEVAEFYEAEVDQTVSNLSSVLEPALMLIVGIGVAILALGLIMPIYSITQAV